MKGNAKKIILRITVILVLIISALTLYFFTGEGRREIKVTKQFMKNIEKDGLVKDVEYGGNFKIENKKLEPKENIRSYKVSNKKYLLEFNDQLEIISFTNNVQSKSKKEISEEKAITLATQYIEKLCNKEYKFQSVSEKSKKENVPYYSLKFIRVDDGYPYYGMEAVLNIDKGNGDLLGYVNKVGNVEHGKINVVISRGNAEEVAKEQFKKLGKKTNITGETYLAYCARKEVGNKSELCYVVNLDAINKKNEKESYIYFVSSTTGQVVNSFRKIENQTYEE